jgi:uncharacterized membrane-anchored protein YhcB (DUF1043 family)
MMDKKYEGTGFVIVGFIIGILLTWAVMEATNTQKKYKVNLKCIQGELYEEVKTNMFIKSHLECFEQRSF